MNISWTSASILVWFLLFDVGDPVEFFFYEGLLIYVKKLGVNQTILCTCSGEHQFSVKDFVGKEILPYLIQFWDFVKNNKILHANPIFFVDFIQVLIRIEKAREEFQNALEMWFFSRLEEVFCPVTIDISL